VIAIGWATLATLVLWVVMWTFGVKALDSFLLGIFVFLLPATAWWFAKPWLLRQLGRE
jgi:hypothetical protein